MSVFVIFEFTFLLPQQSILRVREFPVAAFSLVNFLHCMSACDLRIESRLSTICLQTKRRLHNHLGFAHYYLHLILFSLPSRQRCRDKCVNYTNDKLNDLDEPTSTRVDAFVWHFLLQFVSGFFH